jgi:hypothetical protein
VGPDPTLLVLLVWFAQPPRSELPGSVARIQRELARPLPAQPVQSSAAVFRVRIEARPIKMSVPWDPANDTVVPAYIRPKIPLYHFEFLQAVTPEAFRAGVLFPISIDVLPAVDIIVDAVRESHRRRQEERARREVDEALKRLLEARKKAGLPE